MTVRICFSMISPQTEQLFESRVVGLRDAARKRNDLLRNGKTNGKLLIQNVFYRILIAFGDQSNLFSIRLVTIYDLVIVLLQLFDCAIRII